MIYLGSPLPELEIIYPICVKGCRFFFRDAEFLEDIRYIYYRILCCVMFISGTIYTGSIVLTSLALFFFLPANSMVQRERQAASVRGHVVLGGREREREGGREGGRERGRERGREGGREGEREGGREGGKEGRREGGANSMVERETQTASVGGHGF